MRKSIFIFLLSVAMLISAVSYGQPEVQPVKDTVTNTKAPADTAIVIPDSVYFIGVAHFDSVYQYLVNNLTMKQYQEGIGLINVAFNKLYMVAYAEYVRKHPRRPPPPAVKPKAVKK